jgi:transposase
VYDRERRVLLRHYLEQGWTKIAIAEHLGIDRRTISRWLQSGQLDRDLDTEPVRYTPRPPVPTKLDTYKPLIETRLAQYPRLSAVRLFAEARAAGYTGSLTQLKVFVRAVRPRPEPEPVIRFETAPGHQAQVDFAEVKLPWGKRYALLVVLGYSRLLWLRFYARQDLRTLFAGLEEAFAYFGGVPRECLFDQMKAVITRDERLAGGPLVRNAEFVRFAAHWGFVARACRPYRAQTKGKVERPIRYVRESFLYGREFLGDGDLDEQRGHWLEDVANARVHGTTKEVPRERFARDERIALQPLATRPYRSRVLAPERLTHVVSAASARPHLATPAVHVLPTPSIAVERRGLAAYAQLAEAYAEEVA